MHRKMTLVILSISMVACGGGGGSGSSSVSSSESSAVGSSIVNSSSLASTSSSLMESSSSVSSVIISSFSSSVAVGSSSTVSSSSVAPVVIFPSGTHPSLNSSNATWDEVNKTFTITKNVTFTTTGATTQVAIDNDKEGFYWNIPTTISKVIIAADVKVTGHFRFTSEQTLEGANRDTSVIYGTPTKAWARGLNGVEDVGTTCSNGGAIAGDDRVHDCEKWKYGAVSVVPAASQAITYKVKNLTVENPRTYGITAISHKLEVDRVIIKNTRPIPDYQSNSDGFGGGVGSSISNSKIDTWDDAIKLYRDGMSVKNVTIVHNQNGAPFQLGWGNHSALTATIENTKVVQAAGTTASKFNLALFSNSGGTVNPTVNISGLQAEYASTVTLNQSGAAVPMPIVYIKGADSIININSSTINGVGPDIKLNMPAGRVGVGTLNVLIDGVSTIQNTYTVGSVSNVTGCANCP